METLSKVAVVIPYYQRSPGILRRALESIAAQKVDEGTRIVVIVVDDDSPHEASREIDGLCLPEYVSISVHRQPNGGPAVARNTGLDLVPSDANWIAFLDSDDEWLPDHIRTALSSLKNGADLYFCDHKRAGFHDTYFPSVPFPLVGELILPRQIMLTLTLRYMPSHLSTMVFRTEIGSATRFDGRLRGAGEDLIFIVELACLAERIAVSSQVNVACGNGVNICFGNLDWNAPGNLLRAAEQVWAFTLLARMVHRLPVSSDDSAIVELELKRLRREFAFLWLRKVLRKIRFPNELLHLIRNDKRTLLWFPSSLGVVVAQKALGMYETSVTHKVDGLETITLRNNARGTRSTGSSGSDQSGAGQDDA
ncbi:glycosyltransferase family 2 protein [Microvirga sp. BSC39]|uniref:glycosyltransferase family 2 protein n=1 Tax=Microvirga sp. BSC39 TaxID=1549810 RepID=UPI0004E88B63|nr:glycosyltransferase family 2 protein [Microvirga sp. BSC39]KFG70314.1 hypothetical protein JH26_05325 [Microvirga sp. BSC39]